jgi:hypothetical protein
MRELEIYLIVMATFIPACLIVGKFIDLSRDCGKRVIREKDKHWLKTNFRKKK